MRSRTLGRGTRRYRLVNLDMMRVSLEAADVEYGARLWSAREEGMEC